MKRLVIAIVGNPNCGKTTLFNGLTGAHQYVGNWPGVTVDRKEGTYSDRQGPVLVVDLPGVYSLSVLPGTDSLDEKIARDYILANRPDVVVNIVDASNLERNLYLTTQLLEMRVPMVVALNMMDVAESRGIEVDVEALAERLGCPVVPLVASRHDGVDEIRRIVRESAAAGTVPTADVTYSAPVAAVVDEVEAAVRETAEAKGVDGRWLAVRLLEGDDLALSLVGDGVDDLLRKRVPGIESELGEDMDILIADGRYAFANGLARGVSKVAAQVRADISDAIDRVVLNRWLGLPLFFALMYVMFTFTINVGGAFIDFFDQAAGAIFVDGLGRLMLAAGSPQWLKVLLADGVGSGIQVVGTFIPIIGCLYLFLSFLEDSGYMSRAAFLMDRFMRRIGLPGKAFVPLIVGFGCNVPGIMATRTLDKPRDRVMAVLMSPFMSCGARLAVYALFAAAFFPVGGQNMVFALYVIGVAAAVGTGFMLRHTLLQGETTPFLMELPPYHMPQLSGILLHSWTRLKSFMFGAGRIIIAVVVVLSFLNSWGTDGSFGNQNTDRSVLSEVGRAIVPAFAPMGIDEDNWPATVGIFTGVFAKEAVVGTLDALYSGLSGDQDGAAAQAKPFNLGSALVSAVMTIPANLSGVVERLTDPLGLSTVGSGGAAEAQGVAAGTFGAMVTRFDGRIGAFSYLLFILLYVPCVAALSAIVREVGPRWATFAAVWTTSVAYTASVCTYQAATFARHPSESTVWIVGLLLSMAAFIFILRLASRSDRGPLFAPAE